MIMSTAESEDPLRSYQKAIEKLRAAIAQVERSAKKISVIYTFVAEDLLSGGGPDLGRPMWSRLKAQGDALVAERLSSRSLSEYYVFLDFGEVIIS
jgi:hypothetical protein